MKQMPIEWWKDKKLMAGMILVILSIILGLYSKGLLSFFLANLLNKLYKPFYLLTGLSIYVLSWVLLFLGVFLVGLETLRMIQHRIQHHVRKTVKDTYDYTKGLPKKGYHYTKKLHKKGMDRLAKTSKAITENIKK